MNNVKRLDTNAPLYVIECPTVLRPEAIDHLKAAIKDVFDGAQVLVLDGGQTIEALTDSALAALGLKRIEEAEG